MNTPRIPDLSVVLPVLNEERILPELLAQLEGALKPLNISYEIIFVSDGSTDATAPMIRDACRQSPSLRLVELSRNFGHQAALSAGLDHARGRRVAMMDADLQDDPAVLPLFWKKMEEGFEVVYAKRYQRKETFVKRWMFRLYHRVLRRIASVDIPPDAGIFSMMDRRVADVLRRIGESHRYLSGLRAWAGFRQTGIETVRPDRPEDAGPPKQSLMKLFNLSLDGIFAFSYLPLHLSTWFGIIFFFGAILLVTALVMYRLFTNLAPPGWTSILGMVLLVGAMQFVILGILGGYIGRIYDEVKRRPLYIVASKAGFSEESAG